MKRVLLLAYLFPPIANSGTQRPLKFAKYLTQYGWEPIVMTASHCEAYQTDPALLDELPKSVRVMRVPMLNELIVLDNGEPHAALCALTLPWPAQQIVITLAHSLLL